MTDELIPPPPAPTLDLRARHRDLLAEMGVIAIRREALTTRWNELYQQVGQIESILQTQPQPPAPVESTSEPALPAPPIPLSRAARRRAAKLAAKSPHPNGSPTP